MYSVKKRALSPASQESKAPLREAKALSGEPEEQPAPAFSGVGVHSGVGSFSGVGLLVVDSGV